MGPSFKPSAPTDELTRLSRYTAARFVLDSLPVGVRHRHGKMINEAITPLANCDLLGLLVAGLTFDVKLEVKGGLLGA